MSMNQPHHVVRPNESEGGLARAMGTALAVIMFVPATLYAAILLPIAIAADKTFLQRQERRQRREAMKEGRRIERRQAMGIFPW